jgi:hypothetical protein
MGRPSIYSPQIADELAAWIAEGKTLREFCRQEGKPSYGAVYDWMERDKEFASRIARAREIGEEVIAQECLGIADDATNDWMERTDKEGEKIGWMLNGEHVQRSKLRIETRLKLLAKWNPRKYGDKLEQFISGPEGGPIQSEHRIVFVEPK